MKKIDRTKETHRLWWEYLKLSELYKAYCESVQEGVKENKIKYFTPEDPATGHKLAIVESVLIPKMPKKFEKECRERGLESACHLNYDTFGDVRVASFDKWWEHNKQYLDKRAITKKGICIFDKDTTEYYFNDYIGTFKRTRKREPTMQEFKDFVLRYLGGDKDSIHIEIFPRGKTIVELQETLGKIISKRRKDIALKAYDFSKKAFREPTVILPPKDIMALKGYLVIYKLRKESLLWKDVFTKYLTPKALKEYEEGDKRIKKAMFDEARSELLRAYRKTEKVIKNVERGIFPGDYQ